MEEEAESWSVLDEVLYGKYDLLGLGLLCGCEPVDWAEDASGWEAVPLALDGSVWVAVTGCVAVEVLPTCWVKVVFEADVLTLPASVEL